MAKQGISIREASRRLAEQGVEISEGGIRKWIRKKLITPFGDGSLDPGNLRAYAALAKQEQSPIHGGKRAKGQVGPTSAPAEEFADETPNILLGKKPTFEDARTAREAYQAGRAKLALGKESKELVELVKANRAFADLGASTRAVFERLPDRLPAVLSGIYLGRLSDIAVALESNEIATALELVRDAESIGQHRAWEVLSQAIDEGLLELSARAGRLAEGIKA